MVHLGYLDQQYCHSQCIIKVLFLLSGVAEVSQPAPPMSSHVPLSAPMSTPFSMGMPLPAPAPAVNAWEKPITITPAVVATSSVTVAANGEVKFDNKTGGDQHDSGIDISEPQNSGSSSTRSSPSTENKLRGTDLIAKVHNKSLDVLYSMLLQKNPMSINAKLCAI